MAANGALRSVRRTASRPSRPVTAPTEVPGFHVGAVRGREKGSAVIQAYRVTPFAAGDRSYGGNVTRRTSRRPTSRSVR